jgi:hypothetical protein
MLVEALADPDGRVKSFRRDGWATPWPTSAAMLAYMVTHDAHHRGQACMLARQLGFPLVGRAAYGMWAWERLRKESGFRRAPATQNRREGTAKRDDRRTG